MTLLTSRTSKTKTAAYPSILHFMATLTTRQSDFHGLLLTVVMNGRNVVLFNLGEYSNFGSIVSLY
jgi:hypothetical protein